MQFPDQPQKLQLATRSAASINQQLNPATAGLTIGDIYFILFRHKWKIILCSLLGLGGAAALYKFSPPPYQSEAKLFIRYVMDNRSTGPSRDDTRIRPLDTQVDSIISSELEIMTSLDLVAEVVDAIGPEKIIPAAKNGETRTAAIRALSKSLAAETPPHSSVVHVVFRNPNRAIVQPVLREVIDRYLKKHVEIHRALGITGDFLTQETDRLRARLTQTQEELRSAENKVGVASIEDAKKSYAEQISKLRQESYAAEAEFAERSTVFKELTGKSAHVDEPEKTTPPPPRQEQIDDYRKVNDRVGMLRHKEQELLTQFTEENSRVKELRVQLNEALKTKQEIEEASPGLKNFEVAGRPSPTSAPVATTVLDVSGESARLKALEGKIQTFRTQIEQLKTEASKVGEMEATIQELRRRKELEAANYKYYSASLEQARIDEALGAGHVSNISEIQSPSPPLRDRSKSLKLMMILAIGGVASGLSWAFALEMFLDRTVKRPVDLERVSRLPLFISIPRISSRDRRRFAKQNSLALTAIEKSDDAKKVPSSEQPAKPVLYKAPPQLLYNFHETLRDRLIAYFESINLTHKPKLVAVTGLSRGSGVTTVAAGLAQCLSETGEGNVLLVDMTARQGSSQQFFQGQKVCGLDELLHTRNNALIQEKLYVVQEGSNSESLSRNLPQRFTKLIPKLKASDFDYIIFDMPPVSQISVTPRLASFMDMVLLVVESEKNDREVVERATALLAQSKANVGMVLNKTRSYVPSALHQESLGQI